MSDQEDNVVHLPRRDKAQGSPLSPSVETPAERARRAQDIRDNLKTGAFKPGENRIAARGLHVLLERLKRQSGKTVGELLHAAGRGADASTASRYLSQYAIPEGGNESRLRKKPRAYAEIAEKAARHVAFSSDQALLAVFEATSLAQPGGKRLSSDAGPYGELTERINRIVDDLARRHRLQAYFRKIHRARVSFVRRDEDDPSSLRVAHGLESQPFLVTFGRPNYPSAGTVRGSDFVPPFPSLPLACVAAHEIKLRGFSADGDDPHRDVKIELRLCINLCIVPVGDEFQPRASFEVTLWPEFQYCFDEVYLNKYHPGEELKNVCNDDHALFWDLDYDGEHGQPFRVPYGDELTPSRLPETIREIFCQSATRDKLSSLSLAAKENSRFLMVDGRCRKLLDLSLDHEREPLEQYGLREDVKCTISWRNGTAGFSGIGASDFAEGTIGAHLDRLIWQAKPNLLEQLDARAQYLIRAFERERNKTVEERTRALASLDARIKSNSESD